MKHTFGPKPDISPDYQEGKKGKKITEMFPDQPSEDKEKLKSKYWGDDPILTELINSGSINYSSEPDWYKGKDIRELPKETIQKIQEALIKLHQMDPKRSGCCKFYHYYR